MDLSKRREYQCAVPDAYSVETFPGMRTTLLQAQSEEHRHVVWEDNSELYYLLVLTGAASPRNISVCSYANWKFPEAFYPRR
jgi:hypothetical protein